MWENTVTVDIGKMGKVKGGCLYNTRIAVAPVIKAKYGYAWEAEQHCTLHAGNAPKGVWVPLFFSYYATIDGVYRNWGHVMWQAPDGSVYSDGVKYASKEAYMKNHTPKYVGWGEILEGVRVVKWVAPAVPATPRVDKSVIGKTLYLSKSVKTWHVYPRGVRPTLENSKAVLKPSKFGGLSYKIYGISKYPQTVTIKTADFGVVDIFVDKDATIK